MADQKYKAVNFNLPQGTNQETIDNLKDLLAEVAANAGYFNEYHHTALRGSVGRMLVALAEGKAKVVNLANATESLSENDLTPDDKRALSEIMAKLTR